MHEEENISNRKWSGWLRRPFVILGIGVFCLLFSIPFVVRAWRLSHLLNLKGTFDRAALIAEASSVPPSENAAVEIVEAGALFHENAKAEKEFDDFMRNPTTETTELLRSWVKDNQACVAVLREGASKSRLSYYDLANVDLNAVMDFSQKIRKLNRLLIAQSHLQLEDNDVDGAFETLQLSFRLALLPGKNGLIIEKLLSAGSVTRVISDGLIPWGQNADVTEENLVSAWKSLQADWEELGSPASRQFMVESIYNESELRNLYGSIAGHYFVGEPDYSIRLHRQVIANLLTQCDLPPYQRTVFPGRPDCLYEVLPTTMKPGMMSPEQISKLLVQSPLLELSIESISQYQVGADRHSTKFILLEAAFVLEIFRRRHGEYPEQLEQLDSDLKNMLAHDPYNDKPLIYLRESPETCVIYSVGENRLDDHGVDENGQDIVLQLEKPKEVAVDQSQLQ